MRQPGTHNRGRRCCRRTIEGKTRLARLLLVTVVTVFVGCGSASAQVGTTAPAPVGATSPLGIGSAPALPQTGTSLGPAGVGSAAMTLPTVGISPLGSAATNNTLPCSGSSLTGGDVFGTTSTASGASGTGMSASGTSTSVFDGGGNTPAGANPCAPMIESTPAQPAASASSPTASAPPAGTGRSGIPMGSTELGGGGLSPPPAPSSAPSATSPAQCSANGMASTGATSAGSC
jgi:hypothetical protein